MRVKEKDLKRGDVIRIEYGDFNNYVTVIVDHVVVEDEKMFGSKIVGKHPNGDPFVGYGTANADCEVLERGKA